MGSGGEGGRGYIFMVMVGDRIWAQYFIFVKC